ncbi:lipoyl(octanoyl) transferase [Ceratobasidium sp. AG-Ba]|nr:lipoyl(octanoyl) transferase [Ceratobasidium sp. AG-Ba]
MPLPPILTHLFPRPLPYLRTLAVQNKIHALQLEQRRADPGHAPDVLLLLQHRPVYTAGRRQKVEDLQLERARLEGIGADWVQTDRGGQTTYHGPGQLTAYPLLDLGRMKLSIRDYICQLELSLREQLKTFHNLVHHPCEHTGVFLSPDIKIASIGVHVRHRLTTHGIAMNITREPRLWFDEVVACGLDGVRAGSIEGGLGDTLEREVTSPKSRIALRRYWLEGWDELCIP